MRSACLSRHQLSNFLQINSQLELVPILVPLEMRSEVLLEIPSEDNFYLKLYMLLVLRIVLVTVNKTPFLDSLITLGNLKEESGFEWPFLAILGTMSEFARQKAPRSVTFFIICLSPLSFTFPHSKSASLFKVPVRCSAVRMICFAMR